MNDRQAPGFRDMDDFGQFPDGELGLIEFGTADNDRLVPQDALVEIGAREWDAIRDEQQVRMLEVRRAGRDQG